MRSRRPRRWKQLDERCPTCGKARFPTRADATEAARRRHDHELVTAYKCTGYWHIGHDTPRRKKRRRKDPP